ncbi:AraC family transcriptional regulator [Kaarinaea lacus]
MKKTKNWTDYEQRLGRVIAHIHDHLDDDLDLNQLAEVACLSPYHWHRIYYAIQGETIVATVKRLRLHRAAGYLAHTSMPIDKVAKKSGYKNLQSFTRIFKSEYGMPPAQYRKAGSHTRFHTDNQEGDIAMYDVTIKTIPAMQTASVAHVGSYMQISQAFETLYGWLAARNLIGPDTRSVGIYYDDPDSVPEAQLRSKAGIVVQGNFAIEAPLEPAEIAGGPYAVLRYQGPYADMKAAYQWLYGVWLVQSEKEPADAPAFEEYLNNPRDTAPSDLLTDIYLPLNPASP